MKGQSTDVLQLTARSFLSDALAYARRKWLIFPLVLNTKRPLTLKGFKNATTCVETIQEWWSKWPIANIGIRTGAESGIIVLDVDVKKGAPGLESLADLKAEFGPLPPTLKVNTPSGGRHFYFKHPGGKIKNRAGFRPGLDLRGDGGYIVAPPSQIDGVSYQWVDATNEIAEVPAPLLQLLQSRKRAANNGSIAENISVTGMDGAPAGQRNYSIFRYSASLRSREVPRNEAEVLVLTKAKNCEPPLPEEEALQCLESAYSRYEPGTSRPCTELGNAERFVDQYGNIIRYLPGYISWFIWKESRWHEDKLGEINQFAKKVVRSIHQEALDSEDHDRRDALLKHARNSERSSALNNMISLAATNEGIALSADALDSHDHLLGVQNGTVDLRTGIFRKSDPVDYITKASKASYDKDADCPLWKRFTLAITGGDKEFPQFLQRCIGYMLMGGNPEQIILILYGTGANGKSTFLRIVQLLLGTYSRTVESSLFLVNRFNNSSGPREDIVRLQGARLIHTTEIGEGEVLNEDLVKRMTGDDTLAGRLPYGKSTIEFQPKFVPCMASNHKPIIRGDDHAIWRRIILIPFTQTFSGDKQDKNLFRKLERELSGILNWAIEGCLAWQEQGLQIPESVTRATFDYRDEMDLLAEWIEICCETGPECAEATAVLYMGYSTWCEENGVQRPLDNRTFGRKLAAKGFKRTKPCGKRGFAGIRVLNEHEKKLKIQGSLAPRSQPPTPTTTSPDIPPPLRFRGVS